MQTVQSPAPHTTRRLDVHTTNTNIRHHSHARIISLHLHSSANGRRLQHCKCHGSFQQWTLTRLAHCSEWGLLTQPDHLAVLPLLLPAAQHRLESVPLSGQESLTLFTFLQIRTYLHPYTQILIRYCLTQYFTARWAQCWHNCERPVCMDYQGECSLHRQVLQIKITLLYCLPVQHPCHIYAAISSAEWNDCKLGWGSGWGSERGVDTELE